MQCQAELALKTAENEQLTNQLQTALQLLEAEKKAREELLKTIMEVKAGAEKVSGEICCLTFFYNTEVGYLLKTKHELFVLLKTSWWKSLK